MKPAPARPLALASLAAALLGLALLAVPSATATNFVFVRTDNACGIDNEIAIGAGDLDEDGRPDLVFAGFDDDAVAVMNTKLGFKPKPPVALSPFDTPFWVSVTDWDGDGHLDAIIADVGTNYLSFLKGDGKGNLAAPTTLTVGFGPIHVRVADVDLDGKNDLVVANSSSNFITILFQKGGRLDVPVPFESHTTSVRDFDEDGFPDIAVSFSNVDEEVGLLINDKKGGFLPYKQVGTGFGYHMAAGDFNGDGHVDLVTAPLLLADVWLLLGNGDGTFTTKDIETVGPFQNDVQADDLDCDGLDDAVVVGGDESRIYVGDRAQGLTIGPVLPTGPESTSVAIADYDGDGVHDLAFPNFESPGMFALETNVTVILHCPEPVTIDPGPACLVDLKPTTCDTTLTITSVPVLPAALPPGPTDVTFTATDPDNRTESCTTRVTVVDSTPPVLQGVPADATVECSPVPPPAKPVAVDCDPNVTIDFQEKRRDGKCPFDYTLVRTWNATDTSKNSSSATQTVTVEDTTPPVVAGCALDLDPPLPRPPAKPAWPASPRSPRSPASAACVSSAAFRVRCGSAADACDPSPALTAELVVRRHEVKDRACVLVEDVVPVACGELVRLRPAAPPCLATSARPPRPPKAASSSSSSAVRVIEGEQILLRVRASDACGNEAKACEVDAVASSGLCAPAPPKCAKSDLCR